MNCHQMFNLPNCVRSRLSSLMACGLAVLSGGLLHCSSEVQDPEGVAGSGAGATATAGAPGGSGTSTGGSASSGTGGVAVAGSVATGGQLTAGDGGTGTSGTGTVLAGSGGASVAGGGGSGGAGGTSVGSGCANDAFLCDDFEQYPAASAPAGGWTQSVRGNGKIVVDTTRAFTGKQSLHVTGSMNADRANISKPLKTDSPTAYVRFMMYATSYPASSGVHTRLMRIGNAQAATGNPDSSYSLASYNGTAIEKVNSIYLRDTGTKFNDPKLLNRWTCWEFAIDRSGGVGKVKVNLWVDGRELTLAKAGSSSHGMTSASWDPIPFELFMLGLDGFQSDPQPADFWIDDLSVTPQRVGCKAAPQLQP